MTQDKQLEASAEKFVNNYEPQVFQHIDKEWLTTQLIKFAAQFQPEHKQEQVHKEQNDRMRVWFEEKTGIKDGLLSEHMQKIDAILQHPQQPISIEAIEKMAEKEYPFDQNRSREPIFTHGDITESKRKAYIKGANAILSALQCTAIDSELFEELKIIVGKQQEEIEVLKHENELLNESALGYSAGDNWISVEKVLNILNENAEACKTLTDEDKIRSAQDIINETYDDLISIFSTYKKQA